jgi:NADH:ubiquinone oxidoreductase subunit
MTIGTLLFTRLFGEKVGGDPYGNVYYQHRKTPSTGRRKRWVIYVGEPEASRVPPEWHAWLHYTIDAPPLDAEKLHKPWQKPHIPNLTGSPAAYRPPGHTLRGGHRAKGTGDYEPWTPV